MNRIINQISQFYHKNRKWIIGGLAFLLLLQLCSRGGRVAPPDSAKESQPVQEAPHFDTLANGEKPLEQLFYEKMTAPPEKGPSPLLPFFIMTALVALVYVVIKYKLAERFMPAWVSVRARTLKKQKEQLLRIAIHNYTKESITFATPVVVFERGKKSRKFKIKGGDGQNLFPLTLMPKTGHQLTISIDKFRASFPELKKYKKLRVIIEADNGKTYRLNPDSLIPGF
jgi:hypothetical protein